MESNNMMNTITESPIRSFYKGKSVFVTGATGFLGKVLVEKLIRSCVGLNKVYILLRSKDGASSKQRLDDFINSKCFDNCDRKVLAVKLIPIDGDITKADLGLSEKDRSTLVNQVNIVFHSAASVKFDDPLKQCLRHNVLATKSVLELCHQISNLEAFVHISTAYAYCHREVSEEKLYPLKISPKQLLDSSEWLDDETFEVLGQRLAEGRPNTYTFTKAVAEHYINDNRGQLPVAILRPSIITASCKEPVAGWIDSINGPAGACLLGTLGIARTMRFHPYKITDFIPVDIVTNSAIAVAWATGTSPSSSTELKVYNCTSGDINPITWKGFLEAGRVAAFKYPSTKMVRPPAHVMQTDKVNPIRHGLTKFFSEIVFAHFLDMVLQLLGYKQIMVRIVQRMHNAFNMLEYFAQREWSFPCDNLLNLMNSMTTEDKETFFFDIRVVKWDSYIETFYMGVRRFLLKEDDSTIEKGKQRLRRLQIISSIVNKIVLLFWILVIWKLVGGYLFDLSSTSSSVSKVIETFVGLSSNANGNSSSSHEASGVSSGTLERLVIHDLK